MHEEWLTTGQAARLAGTHVDTIRRWCDRGDLRAWRTPGGQRRIRRSDLAAILPKSAA